MTTTNTAKNTTIDVMIEVSAGLYESPEPTEPKYPTTHDYYTIKDIREMGLRINDYIASNDGVSPLTIAESIATAPLSMGEMWTIAECEHTTNGVGKGWGLTQHTTTPYLIARVLDGAMKFRLIIGQYRSNVYEYGDKDKANYRLTNTPKRSDRTFKSLVRLLEKWRAELPQLTIYMLLNAYSEYSDKAERNHKNVSDFSVRYKKRVKEIIGAYYGA